MGPKKKTSTMKWVVKSQQSAKMTEATTEKKISSMTPDSSLLPDCVSKLNLSSSPSETKANTLLVPGWSLLPEELLDTIFSKLENCFDVIHVRSVCRPWQPIFPFPSCILSTSYSLPSFEKFPRKSKGFCTLEKFPVFLFKVRAASPPEFFVGGIGRVKSKDDIELPIQCSVKVKIPGSDPTLMMNMNMLDCQILPLGYQYRMKGYDPQSLRTSFRGVAFLPLNKEGEFVVLIGYSHDLLVLTSAEMRWMRLQRSSIADCKDIVTFRGKFYAVFINGDLSVIDPYTLEATPMMPPMELLKSHKYLVPSRDDEELFLVERINPLTNVLCFSKLICRVSRLDKESGEWVVVTDLGDRVLFIGQPGNTLCSAKELPDGCVSGNSILFINEPDVATYPYKYGIDTGHEEDDLSFWRSSRETLVMILSKSPMAAHLRVGAGP